MDMGCRNGYAGGIRAGSSSGRTFGSKRSKGCSGRRNKFQDFIFRTEKKDLSGNGAT